MTKANLYILRNYDWRIIVDKAEVIYGNSTEEKISIYKLIAPTPIETRYAIISLDKDIDKLITECGVDNVDNDDLLKERLKSESPLYGSKDNLLFV
ncbi:MAG TPA: hypothetical protein VMT76_17320 [Puia sp.]|nr:hypothetical protein [Puia sp.]